jgi:rRNA maturation endonuclease Nob1
MVTDTVKLCPHCKLCYRPDPRQHKDPHKICPRCGKRLVPEEDDDDEK